MSLISEQVKELERHAKAYETGEQEGKVTAISTAKVLRDAIWTIEQQSQRIEAYSLNDGWVPVEKGLPDSSTSRKVTCEVNGHRDVGVAHYNRNNQKWYCDIRMEFRPFENESCKIIAWQPDPEPYEG